MAAIVRVLDRRAALLPDLWCRNFDYGRTADDGPDALRAGTTGRSRLGDQQRDLARRATASGGVDLHRRHRLVLRRPGGAGPRIGYDLRTGAPRHPATEPAGTDRPAGPGR